MAHVIWALALNPATFRIGSLYKISALMGNSPEICKRHYAALIIETMAYSVEFTSAGNSEVKMVIGFWLSSKLLLSIG